jgi:hypothetical protein
MAKRKTGSMLLGALGKNKEEQLKALYPGNKLLKKATKSAPKISKSKNVSSSAKATKDQMLARRRILAGVRDTKRKPGFKTGVVAGGAGAVGIGKYKNKRKEEAKDAADKLLKKQKEKKSRNK